MWETGTKNSREKKEREEIELVVILMIRINCFIHVWPLKAFYIPKSIFTHGKSHSGIQIFPASVTAQVDRLYSNLLIITRHLLQLLLLMVEQYLIPACRFRIAEVLLNLLIIRQRSPLTIFVDLPPVGHPVMSFGASLWQQISS